MRFAPRNKEERQRYIKDTQKEIQFPGFAQWKAAARKNVKRSQPEQGKEHPVKYHVERVDFLETDLDPEK